MKVKRQQLIVVVALVVLAVVVGAAGLLLAVLPQQSHAKRLDAEIAATQIKLASLQRAGHHGPVIPAAQLFALARAMPDSADMPGVIIDLSRAARDSKVSLLSVQPTAAVAQLDGANALPMKVAIVGSWNGIASFLHALRSNVRVNGGKLSVDGRLFTVDTVDLSPNAPAAAGTTASPSVPKGELTANLSINAFSYGVAAPPVVTSTDGTTTTTSTPSGSVQAAGSTG